MSYNSLIDGYCLVGKPAIARKVLEAMKTRGCKPNVPTYSILIKIDEAFKLFKEIPCIGLMPDTITYTTLFGGLCNVGRSLDTYKLVDEMQTHGETRDLFTNAILLQNLCKEKLMKEAAALVKVIEDRGLMFIRRNTLVQFLDEVCGFYNLAYDFVYLPYFITEMNLRYGLVNFTKSSAAKWFMKKLDRYKWSNLQSYFGNFSSLKSL